MSALMYFRLLTEDAYVQTGNYNLSEFYNPNGDNFLIYNDVSPTDVAFPTTFTREWATITSPDYDWGAYGTGLQVSSATVTLPSVTRRTLLYFFDIRGTAERRTLVETSATAAELVAQGLIASDGAVVLRTKEEYVTDFAFNGRIDFGGTGIPILPNGVTVSQVSELYSYNATIDGVNLDASDEAQPVQVYVSPTWLGNERPLFDKVYFADDNVKFANGTYAINAFQGKPLRQVRWFGGVPSENIAAINRAGSALDYSTTKYTQAASVSEVKITENGQEFENADAYNVVNLKRF
jgi:hypothetical protein